MASTCDDCGYRNSEVGFPLVSKILQTQAWSLGY